MEKLSLNEFLKFEKKDLKGKVVCFPTDTVYGIGALYGDQEAIHKIYVMKHRPLDKPLANLVSSVKQITELGIVTTPVTENLMKQYWPGALTIIFKSAKEKISFRMPNCEVALKILDKFGAMATTSVNESGEKELNSYEEINELFANDIDYFITDQVTFSKLPSTVVDASGEELIVLRQGSVIIK